jgi:DNA-binding NarL/FixJ family response regulator
MPAAASSVLPILVVDDDESFRTLLRRLLELAGYEVRDAADGDHALAAARLTRPSLVVLDVRLPGISGYEVLRQLQESVGEDLPVILVSGERVDKEDVVAGLLLGADDYVVKPFHPDELLARIRRSLKRSHAPAAPVNGGSSATLHGLTTREAEVLGLLADGFTQAEIATKLVVSPRTVGTHIQHILSKLDVHSRAQAVALALRNGLDRGDVAHALGR